MKNINCLYSNFYRLLTMLYGRKFRALGDNACLFSPMQIDNPKGITICDNVLIAHNAWLMGTASKDMPGLVIRSRSKIGHFCHIVALNSVTIGEDVLIADKVFISDSTHQYEDISLPVLCQPVQFLGTVTVGDGSWIGENVCILGASIGKHCVIASNSVVNKDIPDYCIVAGAPAKVIKKFNASNAQWERVSD